MMRPIGIPLLFLSLVGCAEFNIGSQPTSFSSEPKIVDVAANDIIRIVTPFSEPRVVTISDADIERNQHVLYVLLGDQEQVSMFVTDAENEANSISLTLKPMEDGVREIDVAMMNQTAIRAASASTKVEKALGPKAKKVATKKPDPWGRPCRLCRDADDNGSSDSDYGDNSW